MKCPWIEQLAPAARLLPQEFANTNDDAFAPVTAMLVIDSGASPVLVKVTDCDALDVPTAWSPYVRLTAESDTSGTTPVPVNATVWGDPGELSVMTMLADSGPVTVGAKCP